jgi:hypothetical protein
VQLAIWAAQHALSLFFLLLTLLLAATAAGWWRGLVLGWVVALAGNGLLNQTLKQMVGRARPALGLRLGSSGLGPQA